MKKLYFFSLLFLICANSFSQEYHRMLDRTSWTIGVSYMTGTYSVGVVYIGDTIIDDKKYSIFYDSLYMVITILREDIIARKVYKRNGGQDKVLFDFSLQVSDKIVLDGGVQYVLQEINYIDVIDGKRREFRLRSDDIFGNNISWVEGLGNISYHPLVQYQVISNPTLYLLCCFQGNTKKYSRGDCVPYITYKDIPKLEGDTFLCKGTNLQLREKSNRYVTWILEDGSEKASDVLDMIVTKDLERIVVLLDESYDTMYVYGKETPFYSVLHTDSLCVFQGQFYNKFKINANDSELIVSWYMKDSIIEGYSFQTDEIGNVTIQVRNSKDCVVTEQFESILHCKCPVLPQDTILCKGDIHTVADLAECEVYWSLDGSPFELLLMLGFEVNKSIHEIVAYSEGRYDTMYVYGKEFPPYQFVFADSVLGNFQKNYCILEFLSDEPHVHPIWYQNGISYGGNNFTTQDTGIISLFITDSLNCTYLDSLYTKDYCKEFSDICAFPTAFSPNGDGLNDILYINCDNIKSAKVMILNRWGEILHISEDQKYTWDGTYKGVPCPTGIYTIFIEYEVYNGYPDKKLRHTGTLNLIR